MELISVVILNERINVMSEINALVVEKRVMITRILARGKGVARGEGEIPPPRNRKNCCKKLVLFPKALFLVTNFEKKKKKIKRKN